MLRAWKFILRAVLAGSLAVSVGCTDDAPPTRPAAGGTAPAARDLGDVVYQGGASDEALASVVGAPPVVDNSRAPVVSEPGLDGQAYEAAFVPSFAWRAVVVGASTPSFFRDVRDALEDGLGVRSASAHGEGNFGNVYLVTFASAIEPKLLRVFTTKTTYTPTAAEWATLRASGPGLSVSVTGAFVENDVVVRGGGPFVSPAPRTFTVRP